MREPGKVAFAPARPGEVTAVELRFSVAELVYWAESLVAVEARVRADVDRAGRNAA